MKLELGNFYVKDIVFGDKTKYENGILTVDKEDCLAFVKRDPHITEADLRIVKPGDMVRLVPVKEAVECRVKVNGDALFPGYTGPLSQAGDGRTHCLKDMSLLAVGRHWGGFQDGLIDMGGEGAKYTYFSQLKNLVLVADTDEDFEKRLTLIKEIGKYKDEHHLPLIDEERDESIIALHTQNCKDKVLAPYVENYIKTVVSMSNEFLKEHMHKHIFLIGMPGAGKTTVGKVLAKELGRDFFDLDQTIQDKVGKSVQNIYI